MRYRRTRNQTRNLHGVHRTQKKANMAKSKKKSARRNPRATQKYNKATGQWESTGVIRPSKKQAAAAAAAAKAARALEGAAKMMEAKAAQVAKASKKAGAPAAAAKAARALEGAAKMLEAKAEKAEDDAEAAKKSAKKAGKKKKKKAGKKRSSKKRSSKKAGKKRSGPSAAALAKALEQCLAAGGGASAGSAAKKRAKKASKRRTPASCKTYTGKRKRPVKCRPKASGATIDACALAATRHGKDPKETCGPGVKKPIGRRAAKARWGKLLNVNSSAWDD